MTWVYLPISVSSQESEGSTSPPSGQAKSKPSATLSKTITRRPSSKAVSGTVGSKMLQSGKTLPHSTAYLGAAKWILSLGASHAKTCPMPGKEPGSRKGNDLDCGGSSPELFGRLDQDSFSWKMCQVLFDEDLPLSSPIWPKAGIMHNGFVYRLAQWERPTVATGFGSSPTHSIPTPTSADHIERKSNSKEKLNFKTNKTVTLDRFAKMWPTPQSRDFRTGEGHRIDDPRRTSNLNDAVAKTQGYKLTPQKQKGPGGQLNPTWVEWLMGWFLGWTVLDAVATEWFRSRRSRRGKK